MRGALVFVAVCACYAQQQKPAPKKDAPQTKQTARAFVVWLARVSGLSATSSGLRGLEVAHQGDVWAEPVGGGARERLTFDGGYSWPVFAPDDRSVIALRGGDLWSVTLNGGNPVKAAHSMKGIETLVGSGPDGIVVLTKEQIGTFSLDSGVFSPFATTAQEDLEAMNRLRAPIRSYDDGKVVVSEDRNTVYIVNSGQKREVAPEKAAVWQPSLSNDRKSLVYVRSGTD